MWSRIEEHFLGLQKAQGIDSLFDERREGGEKRSEVLQS